LVGWISKKRFKIFQNLRPKLFASIKKIFIVRSGFHHLWISSPESFPCRLERCRNWAEQAYPPRFELGFQIGSEWSIHHWNPVCKIRTCFERIPDQAGMLPRSQALKLEFELLSENKIVFKILANNLLNIF